MPHPSPRFSTEGGLEIEKTDSTTVKTIAEPYFLASVNFYRTAIIANNYMFRYSQLIMTVIKKRFFELNLSLANS